MKHASLAAAVLAAACLAPPAALAQQTADWSGLYVGGSFGASLPSSDDETIVFDTNRDGVFDDVVVTSTLANAFSPGFCGGAARSDAPAAGCRKPEAQTSLSVRAGYDLQFGNLVVGAVGEYATQNIGDDVSAFSTTPASYTFTRDLNAVMALRGRLGYAADSSMVYVTAGMAWADLDHSFTTTNTTNTFTPSGGDDVDGYQLGAGYETQFGLFGLTDLSLAVEYLWTSLDDSDYEVAVGPGTAPATNPFLLVDPTGTDLRRTNGDFQFGTLGVALVWRP